MVRYSRSVTSKTVRFHFRLFTTHATWWVSSQCVRFLPATLYFTILPPPHITFLQPWPIRSSALVRARRSVRSAFGCSRVSKMSEAECDAVKCGMLFSDSGIRPPEKPREVRNLVRLQFWYRKITPGGKPFVWAAEATTGEVNDLTVWGSDRGCSWIVAKVGLRLLPRRTFYIRAMIRQKPQRSDWGLWRKIMILRRNNWATMTVVMNCHVIYMT